MIRGGAQNFASILRAINKNVMASFLLIIVLLVTTISFVFVNHRNKEKELASQKINAVFSSFIARTSQKFTTFSHSLPFEHYIHSGPESRKNLYRSFLFNLLFFRSDSDDIVGVDILRDGVNIFSYGKKTNDSVNLDIGDDNDPYFSTGDRSYNWILYFDKRILVEKLKKLNPGLIECDNCNKKVITGGYFGDFPILHLSGMEVNLGIKNDLSTKLWGILFFIIGSLLILVILDINRIKNIFRRYLSDPIVEIASKIKSGENLPQTEVEELSYLTRQIDKWKKQVVELEELRANEKAKEEKIKMMQTVGASIAHELRTPLRSIISVTSGIEKLFPDLLENYNLAKKAGLPIKVINPQKIEQLRQVLVGLKQEGVSANTIVDIFLMNMRGAVEKPFGIKQLSVIDCINGALERYPFQESEKNLIVYDANNDFQFKGDKILIIHILFNLLKNALYYIASIHKGKIYIHLEERKDENVLCFKDTSKGIAKEVLPKIFDRFYSKTEGGAGIGLSFCKMAMEWMSGDITCQSIEGEYTEFILHFPKIKE